jgi:hypothetical protein
MARPSLGRNQAAGDSPRINIKHTENERAEIESVLLPGETLSQFTRVAWKMMVQRRKRTLPFKQNDNF